MLGALSRNFVCGALIPPAPSNVHKVGRLCSHGKSHFTGDQAAQGEHQHHQEQGQQGRSAARHQQSVLRHKTSLDIPYRQANVAKPTTPAHIDRLTASVSSLKKLNYTKHPH